MMVQGAHYILGPFGEDSDLRRWGRKLAERGGKNAKKRAVVAVARKLATGLLMERLSHESGVKRFPLTPVLLTIATGDGEWKNMETQCLHVV